MSERVATERVRELLAQATPGPWTHEHAGWGLHEVTMDRRRGVHVEGEAEAALIAAAPDLGADLLDARAQHARPFRVTPPTPAEVEAQHALGRGGRVEDLRGSAQHLRGPAINPRFLDGRVALRWSPEDAERRPCAWPTAEVSGG
jgi:hypothetical protein